MLFRLIDILHIVYISTHGPALFCCSFVLNCQIGEGFLKHAVKPRNYKKVHRFGYVKIKSFNGREDTIKKSKDSSGQGGSVGVLFCRTKGHRFDSQSGHIPMLRL